MRRAFFIVGPTATGKSELAVDVAREMDAEIVSADAFQIYRGLDLLAAKPDPSTLTRTPHPLIGAMPPLSYVCFAAPKGFLYKIHCGGESILRKGSGGGGAPGGGKGCDCVEVDVWAGAPKFAEGKKVWVGGPGENQIPPPPLRQKA